MEKWVRCFLKQSAVCLEWASLECLLTRTRYPNGGVVIFIRAVWIALFIYLMAISLNQLINPDRLAEFSFYEFRKLAAEKLPWFGAVFAAAYAAIYARFASQWT